jgi:polyhydroxyalkanoate synthesis regulator phasin
MTDVRIKADENGEAQAPSLSTVNRKIEAFVEIVTAAFQKQHERIIQLEEKVKKLENGQGKV